MDGRSSKWFMLEKIIPLVTFAKLNKTRQNSSSKLLFYHRDGHSNRHLNLEDERGFLNEFIANAAFKT